MFYWFSSDLLSLLSLGAHVPGRLEVVQVCHENICRQ